MKLKSINLTNQNMTEGDYFDDCPICQAMKMAKEQGRNLTLSELKEAFKEAKKQGAVVDGKLTKDE